MKKCFLAIAAVATILACSACAVQNNAATSTGMTVSDALNQRYSERQYSDKPLTEKQILDVLWAANGKSAHGRRTAASAVNAQDIDLYLCDATGVSKYDAESASLTKVTDADIRPLFQSQNKFVQVAPISILLVCDMSRFGKPRPDNRNRDFGLIDAGIVSANISLYCTAVGLGTVPCCPKIEVEEIQRALNLMPHSFPVMYHPVGYPK